MNQNGPSGRRRLARSAKIVLLLGLLVLGACSDSQNDSVAVRAGDDQTTSTSSVGDSSTTSSEPTTSVTTLQVPTTAAVVPVCRSKDLAAGLKIDRATYAPSDEVAATISVKNVGAKPCRLPRPPANNSCQPRVVVHFSFDPDGDGNYGPTTWTFGSYPRECSAPTGVVPPGGTVERTAKFPFGDEHPGELPDGEWHVWVTDWTSLGEVEFPLDVTFSCSPGTCKPLKDYAPTSTTTTTSQSSSTTTMTAT